MRIARFVAVFAVLSALPVAASAVEGSRFRPEKAVKDADYDRLDGTGRTRMEVKVIEWEGNIEIHVVPGGSIAGLAVKIDDQNQKNPALIFGYRFTNDALTQLIRRAPMTTKIREGFRVYRDQKTGGEYDKLILTNKEIKGKGIVLFPLDPTPTQLYPSGHPLSGIAVEEDQKPTDSFADEATPSPASKTGPAPASAKKPEPSYDDDSGVIKGGFGL